MSCIQLSSIITALQIRIIFAFTHYSPPACLSQILLLSWNPPSLTGRTTTLDVTKLEMSVNIFYHQGLSLSTQKLYSTGQTRYYSFCQQLNHSPLPSTEQLLLLFVAHLANEGLTHSLQSRFIYQLSVTSTSPQDITKCLQIS